MNATQAPQLPHRARCPSWLALTTAAAAALCLAAAPSVNAQDSDDREAAGNESAISAAPPGQQDQQIRKRLESIYGEIGGLAALKVEVTEGVVRLSGEVANEAQAQQALTLANRIEAVVTVDDAIERTLSVRENLTPLLADARNSLNTWLRAAPLAIIALFIFIAIAYCGHLLANWTQLWRRLAPNSFLAELISQAVRLVAMFFGLLTALSILGASALTGAILGGLGVLGLAVGFAVRETIENYIASIMLSLRQPFRRDDHVVIGDLEGIVISLTTRSTQLMTLDGNHLRIPNATVFKANILNYSRNPERRFGFVLGVDAEDDPAAAMETGLSALQSLEWVLVEPAPLAIIESVGDSNILINFMGWIDQRQTNFGKARSLAIREVKNILEREGFTLPEPIYRLRFDDSEAAQRIRAEPQATSGKHGEQQLPAHEPERSRIPSEKASTDVSTETFLNDIAAQERSKAGESDLLDNSSPTE